MPPKVKISKEDIINKAVELINNEKVLTASSLSKALNCSTQPIFWSFDSMDDVKKQAFDQAHKQFSDFLRLPIENVGPYKATGIRYIQFARNNRGLFKFLFMSERAKEENILVNDSNLLFLVRLIMNKEPMDEDNAKEICKIMWLFCHGIATMIAMNTVDINETEVDKMLDRVCLGLLGGKGNETIIN